MGGPDKIDRRADEPGPSNILAAQDRPSEDATHGSASFGDRVIWVAGYIFLIGGLLLAVSSLLFADLSRYSPFDGLVFSIDRMHARDQGLMLWLVVAVSGGLLVYRMRSADAAPRTLRFWMEDRHMAFFFIGIGMVALGLITCGYFLLGFDITHVTSSSLPMGGEVWNLDEPHANPIRMINQSIQHNAIACGMAGTALGALLIGANRPR
jgi:hypothetical protein